MVYPRINEPVLYYWDLNEKSSHYYYPRAWASHTKLHKEFAILSTVNLVVAVCIFILILSLLRSKKVLSTPLNLYLLFIAIPDCLVAFLCFLTCAMSAPRSQFYSEQMCGFQSFYLNFGFVSNAWLNAVIIFQIHLLLRNSNIRKKFILPSHRDVVRHAAMVYAYAIFWAFLCGFNLSFLPHSSHLYYGFACMPMQYDVTSTLFFWLIFLPGSLGLPVSYAGCVLIDIWWRSLLPLKGRRRKISMFFLRLSILYFAVWSPFLVLFLVGNFVIVNQMVFWFAALMSHLQGLLSALFCLTNDDVRAAVYSLVTCQPEGFFETPDFNAKDSFGNIGSHRFTFKNGSSIAHLGIGTDRFASASREESEQESNSSSEYGDEEEEHPIELRKLQNTDTSFDLDVAILAPSVDNDQASQEKERLTLKLANFD